MILYHGSIINIDKTIKPHNAFPMRDYTPRIYFSDRKEIAMLYAINPIDAYLNLQKKNNRHYSAMSAHINFYTDPIEVLECFPNMFELYKRPAYIYICDIAAEYDDGHQYTYSGEVDLFEKVYIQNVYDALIELENSGSLKLVKFQILSLEENYLRKDRVESGLINRASHCSHTEERIFFEMISQYFPKVRERIKIIGG